MDEGSDDSVILYELLDSTCTPTRKREREWEWEREWASIDSDDDSDGDSDSDSFIDDEDQDSDEAREALDALDTQPVQQMQRALAVLAQLGVDAFLRIRFVDRVLGTLYTRSEAVGKINGATGPARSLFQCMLAPEYEMIEESACEYLHDTVCTFCDTHRTCCVYRLRFRFDDDGIRTVHGGSVCWPRVRPLLRAAESIRETDATSVSATRRLLDRLKYLARHK